VRVEPGDARAAARLDPLAAPKAAPLKDYKPSPY
jgi:hypothetical protein